VTESANILVGVEIRTKEDRASFVIVYPVESSDFFVAIADGLTSLQSSDSIDKKMREI
jgi:hypothetical protein